MSKYKFILFDMDGTIANTDQLIIDSMNILYDKYRGGRRTPIEQIYYFSGPPIADTLKTEFPNMDNDFMVKEFSRISKELYAFTMTSYPDCREVLLDFKRNGIKLGVVTNKKREMTIYCLELLNLEDIFDVVIGYDDVSNGKPNKEGIIKALKILEAPDLNEAVYIGDNKIDMETAHNAHIDCGLVGWGPRVIPNDAEYTFKFESFKDLRRIIYESNL